MIPTYQKLQEAIKNAQGVVNALKSKLNASWDIDTEISLAMAEGTLRGLKLASTIVAIENIRKLSR